MDSLILADLRRLRRELPDLQQEFDQEAFDTPAGPEHSELKRKSEVIERTQGLLEEMRREIEYLEAQLPDDTEEDDD